MKKDTKGFLILALTIVGVFGSFIFVVEATDAPIALPIWAAIAFPSMIIIQNKAWRMIAKGFWEDVDKAIDRGIDKHLNDQIKALDAVHKTAQILDAMKKADEISD